MKISILKTFGGAVLGTALVCLALPAQALQFTLGTPQPGNSWVLGGNTIIEPGFNTPFDKLVVNILSDSVERLEAPGVGILSSYFSLELDFSDFADTTGSWTLTPVDPLNPIQVTATGAASTFMFFDLYFLGERAPNGQPLDALNVDLLVYSGDALVDSFNFNFPGGGGTGEVNVPEGGTTLILLSFGVTTLGWIRRKIG